MTLDALKAQVESHRGTFLCERIGNPAQTKTVSFSHAIEPVLPASDIPNVGRLREFHQAFGGITFYMDEGSGDVASRLAPPHQWAELDSDFRDWFDHLDEHERAEVLPPWIDACLVIGEQPRTGNYLLMPMEGDLAGRVVSFDHDGFEFTEAAADVIAYVERQLSPDDRLLLEMASHMRFIEDGSMEQWWIRALQDNRGNVASTAA